MKFFRNVFLALALILTQFYSQAQDAKAKMLLEKVVTANGGWNKLYKLKDVQFDYNYEYVGADKKDVSVERYIFEGEHSWAKYSRHQINVFPDKDGVATQAYVNGKPSVALDGKMIDKQENVGAALFLRKANYYWFTMMFKLNNPGTIATYKGTESIGGKTYEKVELTFDSKSTGKEANDTYILYINPETNLVDRFFFSLPAMGVNEPILLMEVAYTKLKGIQVPASRKIYRPNEQGKYGKDPFLVQTSSNIQFKNGFKPEDLTLN